MSEVHGFTANNYRYLYKYLGWPMNFKPEGGL
jgi:hypothetical protein